MEVKGKALQARQEMSTPKSAARVLDPMKSQSQKKKRARMMADKTPEGPTPRKRKKISKTSRTLQDMLNTLGSSTEDSEQLNNNSTDSSKNTVNFLDSPDEQQGQEEGRVVAGKSSLRSENRSSTCPSARWGHALCMVSEAEAVLVGGQGDKQQFSKDSIWHLDLARGSWKVPQTTATGQKPEARIGHTAVYDSTVRCIYLYGGSKNLKWFNDVHVLDVDEWQWQLVKANGKAPTRAYHSANLYRHELWVFGGVYPRPDPQPDGCSNDVYVFSPIEEHWYQPIVVGEPPIARSGHSATLLQDRLVVFGGWDAPICYNDLHILDLGIVEWSQPKVGGMPPSSRSWHASCALSGERVLIHGGYNGNIALDDSFIFNLDTMTWTCVKLDPPLAARAGHASLCLPYRHDNEDKDEVLIFGGGDNDGAFFQDLVAVMVPFEYKDQKFF